MQAEDPGGEQFCTIAQNGSLENIHLAHSYCRENISVKDETRICPYIFVKVVATKKNAVGGYGDCAFLSQALSCWSCRGF
jgi:hypothetical protein